MARTHAQQVAEGKRLVAAEGDMKWALGDLALEVSPPEVGVHSDLLATFADEIGVSVELLTQYRRVAAAWPKRARGRASWTVYQLLATYDESVLDKLVKAGKATVPEARKAIGMGYGNRTSSTSTTKDKAAAAKALLSDPAVRRAVVSDDDTRVAINQAAREHHEQVESNVRRKLSEQGKGGQLYELSDFLDIMKPMLKMRTEGALALALLREFPKLTDSQRGQLQREVGWIRETLDLIEGFTSARTAASLADEVEQFLEREAAR